MPFDQVKWTVSVSTCSSVCECFFFQRNHAFFLCPNYLRDFTRFPCAISTSLPPPYPSISQLALEKIKRRRPPSEEKKRWEESVEHPLSKKRRKGDAHLSLSFETEDFQIVLRLTARWSHCLPRPQNLNFLFASHPFVVVLLFFSTILRFPVFFFSEGKSILDCSKKAIHVVLFSFIHPGIDHVFFQHVSFKL